MLFQLNIFCDFITHLLQQVQFQCVEFYTVINGEYNLIQKWWIPWWNTSTEIYLNGFETILFNVTLERIRLFYFQPCDYESDQNFMASQLFIGLIFCPHQQQIKQIATLLQV